MGGKKKVFHCWQVFLRAFTKFNLVGFRADSHSCVIDISDAVLSLLHVQMCMCKGECIPTKLHFASQMRKASEFVKGNCINIIFKQLSPSHFSIFSDIPK